MYSTQTTLAELATTTPAASRVFHRHRLDFCCGGGISLDEAAAKKGLDAGRIIEEIRAEEAPGEANAAELPLGDLIRFIITRYHDPLRAELPRLYEMAAKVERVHGDKASCPRGLAEHLGRVLEEVMSHLAKEEEILFPMIASGSGRAAQGPITVMNLEHDDHAANLRRNRELAHDLVPPAEACNTWRALYLGLAELERDLMDHIHLENNVLFPRALRGQ